LQSDEVVGRFWTKVVAFAVLIWHEQFLERPLKDTGQEQVALREPALHCGALT